MMKSLFAFTMRCEPAGRFWKWLVSGGGFRLGGLRCFLQVQECNVHFFYFFLWGGGGMFLHFEGPLN